MGDLAVNYEAVLPGITDDDVRYQACNSGKAFVLLKAIDAFY